jgi:cytoskeletal protein CcmA (bactofilin family)
MFKKKLDPKTIDTVIGEGTTFEGNIKSEASINVDGKISGNIEGGGTITIGEKGIVRSSISAPEVIVAGTVHGNIKTAKSLTIASTGHLHGDSDARSLTIDEGGVFLGTSKMTASQTEEVKNSSGFSVDQSENS